MASSAPEPALSEVLVLPRVSLPPAAPELQAPGHRQTPAGYQTRGIIQAEPLGRNPHLLGERGP